MSVTEITDRKFLTKVKVVSVDMDKCVVMIDNSERYDWSDMVEIKVGEENRFLFGYFKWCMESEKVIDMEIGMGDKLICGLVEVNVERVEGIDRDGKYIIRSVVEVEGLPDSIEVDVSDVDSEEHLKYVFNNCIENSEVIEVGLGFDESDKDGRKDNNKGYYLKSIQYKYR